MIWQAKYVIKDKKNFLDIESNPKNTKSYSSFILMIILVQMNDTVLEITIQ